MAASTMLHPSQFGSIRAAKTSTYVSTGPTWVNGRGEQVSEQQGRATYAQAYRNKVDQDFRSRFGSGGQH